MKPNNSNSHIKVRGQMSEQGADRYSYLKGIAFIILAIGSSLAMVIYAIKWW